MLLEKSARVEAWFDQTLILIPEHFAEEQSFTFFFFKATIRSLCPAASLGEKQSQLLEWERLVAFELFAQGGCWE